MVSCIFYPGNDLQSRESLLSIGNDFLLCGFKHRETAMDHGQRHVVRYAISNAIININDMTDFHASGAGVPCWFRHA